MKADTLTFLKEWTGSDGTALIKDLFCEFAPKARNRAEVIRIVFIMMYYLNLNEFKLKNKHILTLMVLTFIQKLFYLYVYVKKHNRDAY